MRHIWDEFYRAALASPKIEFEIFEDKKLLISAKSSNLHQRIVSLFGKSYNQRLIPVKEETEVVSVNGFVLKPEYAKKTRGEQYLFVNDRFVKSPYINNSIRNAFEGLINPDSFPGYYIFVNIDPSEIDINIHPTKTEIKFRDDRLVASIVASSVRRSLGVHHAMPSIDFEIENSSAFTAIKSREVRIPQIKINPDYNPFKNNVQPIDAFNTDGSKQRWEQFYEKPEANSPQLDLNDNDQKLSDKFVYENFIQISRRFILSTMKSGLLLVDQNLAHRRLIFDDLFQKQKESSLSSEQLMFPEKISLSRSDSELMAEICEELNQSGFVISQLGSDTFSISARPQGLEFQEEKLSSIIENILEEFKSAAFVRKDFRKSVIMTMARKLSILEGRELSQKMMQSLISGLFQSSNPELSPEGHKIFRIITAQELATLLNNEK